MMSADVPRPSRRLDLLHETAQEQACDLDRDYFGTHPDERSYIRPAVEHEFCGASILDGGPCIDLRGFVMEVGQFEPGIRWRMPRPEA